MAKEKAQVKFKIDCEILAKFKTRCASEGVSMTSVVEGWMMGRRPAKGLKIKTETMPQRKTTVMEVIPILNEVLGNQEYYRDQIPEQFTERYQTADYACDKLAEAIDCLEGAF